MPNWFELVFVLKNRTKPKSVGLNLFWFFSKKNFNLFFFFLIKTKPNKKIITLIFLIAKLNQTSPQVEKLFGHLSHFVINSLSVSPTPSTVYWSLTYLMIISFIPSHWNTHLSHTYKHSLSQSWIWSSTPL
jgi:hypothetical protein